MRRVYLAAALTVLLAAIFNLRAPPLKADMLQAIVNASGVTSSCTIIGAGDAVNDGNWYAYWSFMAFTAAKCGTKAVRLCLHATPTSCQDINSLSATGLFDTGSALTFCVTDTLCDVATFYDQTGDGFDQICASGSRPVYHASIATLAIPGAAFNGSQSCATTATSGNSLQPGSFYAVADRTGAGPGPTAMRSARPPSVAISPT